MSRPNWQSVRVVSVTIGLLALMTACGEQSGGSSASGAGPTSTVPVTSTSSPAAGGSSGQSTTSTLNTSKDYGGGITLATTCRDYFELDSSTRHDAAIRMSIDFKVDSPGNPMWGINLDSVCGKRPDMTLGQYFGQAGAR